MGYIVSKYVISNQEYLLFIDDHRINADIAITRTSVFVTCLSTRYVKIIEPGVTKCGVN